MEKLDLFMIREYVKLSVFIVVFLVLIYIFSKILYYTISAAAWILALIFPPNIPQIQVPLTRAEQNDQFDGVQYDPNIHKQEGKIPCYDPSTLKFLGFMPAFQKDQVHAVIQNAKQAQKIWKKSTFKQRSKLLNIMKRYILENQENICRVASRDSGKPKVDAAFGEILVTLEKIDWVINEGYKWLQKESRSVGKMVFYKKCWVQYEPLGVIGAIVPWNYPFHNVFNPMISSVYAGNAIVIKVSEHASWSTEYYSRFIKEALRAADAPDNLIQIITGYGEAGNALVTGGVDKLIFVGSTVIGKKVMQAAAQNITPLTLELGGKDPFIICDDMPVKQVLPTALRAMYQSCGQNCVAPERFIVHAKIHDQFVEQVSKIVKNLRQGDPLGVSMVDCGAMCMPDAAEKIQQLIDDALSKGATMLAATQNASPNGQFYPPTVLSNVTTDMRVWKEEVFGPVMLVAKFETDDQAIELANHSQFGLGACVWSRDQKRAVQVGSQIACGMLAVNDFASNALCQSLPFGGVKESGFDRFYGVEGLRGVCNVKAVCVDRFPWLMKTDIPPPLQYPVDDIGFHFVLALSQLFYGPGIYGPIQGVYRLISLMLFGKKKEEEIMENGAKQD